MFLTNFLLLVRLIPLDVIVNTEIGKIIVSKMMQEDVEMMNIDHLQSEDGLLRCKVQSLQLPEELGTINHIFSDKTGTLTKNELILRSMSMRGVLMSGEKTDTILQAVYAANCETTDMLFKCFTICTDVTPMLIDGKKVMSGTS